ncbi:MAG: hypothetical protein P8N21_08220 [Opitutales bacterium]|nr:hypothetical protein [Opitutales bacterium]
MNPCRSISIVICLAFSLLGCSRKIDPKTADLEVRKLLKDVPGFDWQPAPSSRLQEAKLNKLPPPPKDDEGAREITKRIQKDGAYEDGNISETFDSGQWKESLNLENNRSVRLDLKRSMELALLHSREFQEQKESLYLSALGVTLERFRLDPIPFANAKAKVTQPAGEDRADLINRTTAGVEGIASHGANWVVSLANRLSVDLSNGNIGLGGSLANLTITQPLLRGANRRIYLESLTQSERSLLMDARRLEQFRQGFFLKVVLGANPAGQLGGGNSISSIPTPSKGVSGFLGLVQEIQTIRNQEANVVKLNESLAQLEAAFEAGRIGNRLQVDQARQALFNGQSRLLAAKSSYENRLDGFKIFLGLPPDLSVRVIDNYIDAFKLTDPDLVSLQEEVDRLVSAVRDPSRTPDLSSLKKLSNQANKLLPQSENSFIELTADYEAFKMSLPARKQGFENLRQRTDLLELGMDTETFADQDLDQLIIELNGSLGNIRSSLDKLSENILAWENKNKSRSLPVARTELSTLLSAYSGTLLELSLAQASARLESIVMESTPISPYDDARTASDQRMDSKNNRAQLVDIWRKADLAKDDLRADLDLVLSGDLGSDALSAGNFESDESEWRVGLELDTPLSKVRERNRYKAALLRYHQARRDYLAFEDSILRAFREYQRLAGLLHLNFELNRAAVRGAIAQVDLARMRLDEPPQPGRNSQFGATTARDLVNALNDLLDASNRFVEVWIGYEAMRMRYAYDLGEMTLSENGLWNSLQGRTNP